MPWFLSLDLFSNDTSTAQITLNEQMKNNDFTKDVVITYYPSAVFA
jgi:hypothetical protein